MRFFPITKSCIRQGPSVYVNGPNQVYDRSTGPAIDRWSVCLTCPKHWSTLTTFLTRRRFVFRKCRPSVVAIYAISTPGNRSLFKISDIVSFGEILRKLFAYWKVVMTNCKCFNLSFTIFLSLPSACLRSEASRNRVMFVCLFVWLLRSSKLFQNS